MEAIVFEDKVINPKIISFGPHTFIPKQLCCNIIKDILFFKIKIFRDMDVEILIDGPRGKLIHMACNKDFFALGFTLDNNIVTKVGIKFMHNLSNITRDIANG